MKRSAATLTLAAALAAGCGNYSNEDIDFQLALPVQNDLEAQMPALTAPTDPPEYLLATRNVVVGFNALIDAFAGLVDQVRALPPTERSPGRRVWGPFPDGERPGWQNRMVMSIVASPTDPTGYRVEYSLDFQRAGVAGAPWNPLLSGKFVPTGGARRGRGELRLDLREARQQGFTVRGFDDENQPDPAKRNKLELLEIAYNRIDFPVTVDMRFTHTADSPSPGGAYQYVEERGGAGAMTFEWQTNESLLVQAIQIRSRWQADGAGRADALVVAGALAGTTPAGTDCWNRDGNATYVHRRFDDPRNRNRGDAASCVF